MKTLEQQVRRLKAATKHHVTSEIAYSWIGNADVSDRPLIRFERVCAAASLRLQLKALTTPGSK